MKSFLIEFKNKLLYYISLRRNIIIILSITTIFFVYIFFYLDTSFTPSNIFLPLTEDKKHLRNLESIYNNQTKNESQEFKNNSNLMNNDTIINNTYNSNITDNEMDIIIRIKQLKLNLTEKIIYYEFIKTITSGFYYGGWKNLSIKKNKFHEKKGEGYISLYRKNDKNYLLNLGPVANSSRVSVYFTIKDGEFIDDYLEGNFTFTLKDISTVDLKNESITFILNDVPITYWWEEYIDSDKYVHLNHTFINLTFYKKFRQFEDYMEYKLSDNNYGNVSLEIKNSSMFQKYNYINGTNNTNETNINNNTNISAIIYEKNFEISFTGLAYGSKRYSKNTLNYSIFITVFCIIEIYLSADFVKLVTNNDQMALNTDIYTVLFHIMWTSLVCGVNFFMSLTRKSASYEYTMPSFCYFSLFSVFLLRILFLAWKARNRDITDMNVFRKKLLRFYLLFYVFLFTTLISIKIWYSYFFFTFILFASTWICQIIYSAKKGTKPPMSYRYILSASLSKISICLYIKGFKNNIFGYRPNYLKVFIVSSVIMIEAIILFLQKFFGAKFIIPKRFRKKAYNYYKNKNEINESDKELECVICLDKIGNLSVSEEEKIKNIKGNIIFKTIIKNVEKFKNKNIVKGTYMLTPCNHLFHTKCLESWLNVKNQCPCCRQSIPPLEN